jgi:dCMP deaminase
MNPKLKVKMLSQGSAFWFGQGAAPQANLDLGEFTKWSSRFMDVAHLVGSWSKDESTQVGAVIVDHSKRIISTGFNGLPFGVRDDVPERHERPEKYFWFEHAERNALNFANVDVTGMTMVVTCFPCADCMRGVLQNGIQTVVCPPPDPTRPDRFASYNATFAMAEDKGINLVEFTQ